MWKKIKQEKPTKTGAHHCYGILWPGTGDQKETRFIAYWNPKDNVWTDRDGEDLIGLNEAVEWWFDINEIPEPTDDNIEYHLKRIKAIQDTHNSNGFMKEKGYLMARVFLRATGAINDEKGNYTIPSHDIFAWFENGDYLMQKTQWDAM